ETTGLYAPGAGLVQVAGIVEIDGEEVETFDLRCRPFPGDLLNKDALQIIGKTREELAALPDPADTFRELLDVLDRHVDRFDKADKFFMVAYNASFDNEHLRAWWKKCGGEYFGAYFWTPPLCVMTLAGIALRPSRPDLPNFKLATVAQAMRITADGDPHDALTDVRLSAGIWRRLLRAAEKKGILR
ncbi:MAG TPA: 3'-5' exonuclease, partial [Syntrophales bacterium]|nr:3'-5' exonuclease [Syntrophales bacterium]